jgi:Kyakuja-Dileera-Zisupton transposase
MVNNRFANTDYALACATREHFLPKDKAIQEEEADIDHITSYDSNCQYCVNVLERFIKSFPDLADHIRRTRWSIPALHVQGHKEECLYNFATAYMPCVGRFHGETTEVAWPELNQLGPHVRQMNNGHRQDTLIDHYGDWNWKKTMKMGKLLLL